MKYFDSHDLLLFYCVCVFSICLALVGASSRLVGVLLFLLPGCMILACAMASLRRRRRNENAINSGDGTTMGIDSASKKRRAPGERRGDSRAKGKHVQLGSGIGSPSMEMETQSIDGMSPRGPIDAGDDDVDVSLGDVEVETTDAAFVGSGALRETSAVSAI